MSPSRRSEGSGNGDDPESLTRALARQPLPDPTHRALLRDEVYTRIRGLIVEGVVAPGTRLRDSEIAETLSISRTPVREAFRRLEYERLVVAEASRWTKVAEVDTDVADELFPIIWTLERLAVTLGAPYGVDEISALRAANDRLVAAIEAGNSVGAHEADNAFHGVLLEAAANTELTTIVDNLKLRIRRIEVAYFGRASGDESVREHERAIGAFEAGDTELAAAEIEGNWRGGVERIHRREAERGRL